MPKKTFSQIILNILSNPITVFLLTFYGTYATLKKWPTNEYIALFTKSITTTELLKLIFGLSITLAFIAYSHVKYGKDRIAFNVYFRSSMSASTMFFAAFNAQALYLLDTFQVNQILLFVFSNIYFLLLFSIPLHARWLWENYLIHNSYAPAIARTISLAPPQVLFEVALLTV